MVLVISEWVVLVIGYSRSTFLTVRAVTFGRDHRLIELHDDLIG